MACFVKVPIADATGQRVLLRRGPPLVRGPAVVLRHARRGRAHRQPGRIADHAAAARARAVGSGLPARRHPADRVDRSPPAAVATTATSSPRSPICPHWPPPTSVTWSSTTPAARTSDRRPARAASSSGSIPIDSATVVADDLDFPNGMVITPDGATLIVAESVGTAVDRVHHRRRRRASASAGSSPTASTGRPTASRSTRRAACGRR